MPVIENLRLHRRDGRVITEDMRPGFTARLGWKIDKVIAATWISGGAEIRLQELGFLVVHLVTGRNFLGVITTDEQTNDSRLVVVDVAGTIRHTISNEQTLQGKPSIGVFSWMEHGNPPNADQFAGIFQAVDKDMFRLDIDAASGKVMSVGKAR